MTKLRNDEPLVASLTDVTYPCCPSAANHTTAISVSRDYAKVNTSLYSALRISHLSLGALTEIKPPQTMNNVSGLQRTCIFHVQKQLEVRGLNALVGRVSRKDIYHSDEQL